MYKQNIAKFWLKKKKNDESFPVDGRIKSSGVAAQGTHVLKQKLNKTQKTDTTFVNTGKL